MLLQTRANPQLIFAFDFLIQKVQEKREFTKQAAPW
jgi:hypothetical protein